ncbi:MAG TPA: Ig-like domain-containing protein, partial [Gammaproteobacteria bacterium]
MSAIDMAGNPDSVTVHVFLDTVVPGIPDIQQITISNPQNGIVAISGANGSVEANSRVTLTNTRTGETITVMADANGAFSAAIAAEVGDILTIDVTDAAGNNSETVSTTVSNLPPDPGTVAPSLDPSQVTTLLDATAFLYTGNNPVQTGVLPGAIEAQRVAVIRGKILDSQNNPLPGVTVTVKDHLEFGQTLSRIDGMFDLAVNGGTVLVLNYEKDDYLPIQREVNAPWQDYIFADDVVLIRLDSQVTTVNLNNPFMQVAQGTMQTDHNGARQATVLFPQGTIATMTLPNGATQSLTSLNVRATEYTVGENGSLSMPAPLPPTSGYTYAVELSVDEALAVNARRVDFNQPVPLYVNNFMNFPVGEVVPVGYYDREKAAWVPSKNGRIIKILSIDNGLATLDVTGSDSASDQVQLAALGITDAEREQLVSLYQVGASLWRAPITHFTPWDCNWPYGPPDDAEAPPATEPKTPDEDTPGSGGKDSCEGCIIEPQGQVLGEEIPLVGAPYKLSYRSDRVIGWIPNYSLNIPLTDDAIPASLLRVTLTVQIAGQTYRRTFAPAANLNHAFEWNGLDAYGRRINRPQTATVHIDYLYGAVYVGADADFDEAFARFGEAGTAGTGSALRVLPDQNNSLITIRRSWKKTLGAFVPDSIAGWNLSGHHQYDPVDKVLYEGNGDTRKIEENRRVYKHFAGKTRCSDITSGECADGDFASDAALFDIITDIQTGPDGSVYLLNHGGESSENMYVYRITPDGLIRKIAGPGTATGIMN